MQQRAHPPVLQVFLHLPDATTRRGSKTGASLAAAVLACACALVLTLAAGVAPAATTTATTVRPCAGANLHPTATNSSRINAAMLCLVNQVRRSYGLHGLHANRELSHVAASQVVSMVSSDYFADDRPSGQTPLSLVAVTRYPVHASEFAVGENIAWGTGRFTTPAHIVNEWMASPPHREIMLSPEYRDAGVAVTPAVPAVLGAGHRGATYAIELGMRLF
jgi:uncharacterized protein YkwD